MAMAESLRTSFFRDTHCTPKALKMANTMAESMVDACKYADTDAAKRGMRNAAADENQPAGDDVGAYKAAQNACQ